MRRVVSVWLPTLPTDLIRRRDQAAGLNAPSDGPLVTVAQEGNTRVLAAVDGHAASGGLRAGMKLTDARILAGALTERPADPDGDATDLRGLAEWCLAYAPLVAPDAPDGLWIDVAGSTHLHGGETRMLQDLIRKLAAQGLAARAAVADTPGLAHAMARFGGKPVSVVPPDMTMPGHFPIEALRLPPETCASLRRMGILQVDQIAAIARGPMARRFGPDIGLRLDQAAGRVFETIRPITPEAAIHIRLGFIEPLLTADAFTVAIDRLTAKACEALSRKGQGARRLDLRFERVDGSVQAIRTGTMRAVRDPTHLSRLLTDRLEKVDPGLGVEAMALIVSAADKLGAIQAATSLFDTPEANLAPLLDRLTGRLGSARVYRVMPIPSHVPERSLQRVPPTAEVAGSWARYVTRPVRVVDPPQPVDAMAEPDQAPVAFVWRRVRHQVRNADGPERIAGEWWQDKWMITPTRDYFRVEDEQGRRFWLFRSADSGRWFLHGLF